MNNSPYLDRPPVPAPDAMKVFQFINHRSERDPRDEGTRWIAAPTEQLATAYAVKMGWKSCGGEIHRGYDFSQYDDRAFILWGCDAVVRP